MSSGEDQPEVTVTLPFFASDDPQISCIFCRATHPCEFAIRVRRSGETAVMGIHATCVEPLQIRNRRSVPRPVPVTPNAGVDDCEECHGTGVISRSDPEDDEECSACEVAPTPSVAEVLSYLRGNVMAGCAADAIEAYFGLKDLRLSNAEPRDRKARDCDAADDGREDKGVADREADAPTGHPDEGRARAVDASSASSSNRHATPSSCNDLERARNWVQQHGEASAFVAASTSASLASLLSDVRRETIEECAKVCERRAAYFRERAVVVNADHWREVESRNCACELRALRKGGNDGHT